MTYFYIQDIYKHQIWQCDGLWQGVTTQKYSRMTF